MGIFLPVALLMDTEARTCKLESLSADLSRNPLGAFGPLKNAGVLKNTGGFSPKKNPCRAAPSVFTGAGAERAIGAGAFSHLYSLLLRS